VKPRRKRIIKRKRKGRTKKKKPEYGWTRFNWFPGMGRNIFLGLPQDADADTEARG
jgi:hypothetical protein